MPSPMLVAAFCLIWLLAMEEEQERPQKVFIQRGDCLSEPLPNPELS